MTHFWNNREAQSKDWKAHRPWVVNLIISQVIILQIFLWGLDSFFLRSLVFSPYTNVLRQCIIYSYLMGVDAIDQIIVPQYMNITTKFSTLKLLFFSFSSCLTIERSIVFKTMDRQCESFSRIFSSATGLDESFIFIRNTWTSSSINENSENFKNFIKFQNSKKKCFKAQNFKIFRKFQNFKNFKKIQN